MSERMTAVDREAAARAAETVYRDGDVPREVRDLSPYDAFCLGIQRAAKAIRALAPDPVAEENKRLIAYLAECFRLSGAEPSSDDDRTLAARAVDAVRRLREDYDEVDPIGEAERREGCPHHDPSDRCGEGAG